MIENKGFFYSEEELAQACKTVGLNDSLSDLSSLCNGKPIKATYLDLRRMADSNLVYMYNNSDSNWDVDRLAKLIEDHPFLYAKVYLTKEKDSEDSDDNCLPYRLTLDTIGNLITFYCAKRNVNWETLIGLCISRYDAYYVEAERHGIDEDGQSCSFKVSCESD